MLWGGSPLQSMRHRGVFHNQKLREACRAAIDVDKILMAAFFDIAPRANTILPPGLLGHWKDAPAYIIDDAIDWVGSLSPMIAYWKDLDSSVLVWDEVMQGKLDDVIEPLINEHQADLLAAMGEE